ncbi:MAG: hypothetical protein OHK0023_21450 [Anaerolineae bacterium]
MTTRILKTPTTNTTPKPVQQGIINSARIAWFILALVLVGLFIYALPYIRVQLRLTECVPIEATLVSAGIPMDTCTEFNLMLDWLVLVISFGMALFVAWKRGHEWLGLITATTQIAIGFFATTASSALISARPDFSIVIRVVYCFVAPVVASYFLIFPTGRVVPRIGYVFIMGVFIALVVIAVVLPTDQFSPTHPLVFGVTVFGLFISGIAQLYRYRRVSTPTQRQQTKVLMLSTLIAAPLAVASQVVSAVSLNNLALEPTNAIWLVVDQFSTLVRVLLILSAPFSVAVAIFRYRLWDLDIFINRTLVLGSLTALLTIVFILAVFVAQRVAVTLTGTEQSNIVVAGAALLVAVLFTPVRLRLQHFVDRRFYPTYLARIEAIVRENPSVRSRASQSIAHVGTLGTELVGETIGPYTVIERIGRGGVADVYKGHQTSVDRVVAIKVLAKKEDALGSYTERFEREARLIANLRHPNIVKLYDYGAYGETYFMVMEYIHGQDLHQHLKAVRRLTLAEALPILQEVASALDYAHSQGLIHRDVKPSNVILDIKPISPDKQYRTVLTDFGIAKVLAEHTLTLGDSVVGTLDYIAPEQITSAREVDHRADIYSLGAMTYQILTGQTPFSANGAAALLMAHLQKQPTDPRVHVPELPQSTAKAILRALEKEPSARPSSASSLVNALMP